MRQFRTDEQTSEREMHIAAIKKVIPNFNPEGKSDELLVVYLEAIIEMLKKNTQANENPKSENGQEMSEDAAIEIQNKRYARLNMHGNGSEQGNLQNDSADQDINSLKQARLNLKED